jgi:uncharacterized protein
VHRILPPDAIAPPLSRRRFLQLGAAAATAGVGLLGYTLGVEPEWVHVVERTLPIAALPRALDGARLVQVSDLHAGPRVRAAYLVDCFDRVRALRPDVVVVTGDFVSLGHGNDAVSFGRLREILPHLPRGRLATLGILGNHDYGRGWAEPAVADRVVAEAGRAGVDVLRNETRTVLGLDVVGVDDLWSGRAAPMRALAARAGRAALVLCHNPDALDDLAWGDYRGWVLAGHTHGGQCKPPFLPAPIVPVKNPRYVAGAVDAGGGRTLYINRGLGYILRARFNVRPEITAFTLRADDGHPMPDES